MAQMSVRIDDNLKVQAEMLFAEIAMPLSTAVTIFLKQAVRSNGMPFPLKADPFFSAEKPGLSFESQRTDGTTVRPAQRCRSTQLTEGNKKPGHQKTSGLSLNLSRQMAAV